MGQALALQSFAATHNVKMVMILIGANNYHFADLIQSCVTDWLTSPSWWKNYCNDDSSVDRELHRVERRDADDQHQERDPQHPPGDGATPATPTSQYTLMVQTYWSPLPLGSGIRYSESGYTRQSTGGCGVWNADAELGQQHRARDVQQLGAQRRSRRPG